MGTKYKNENKITPLYTLNLEVILYYITLTHYDIIKWHIETTNNYITIYIGAKYNKENKITPLLTLNLEVILHYITLTGYDIVNDT